MQRDEHHDSTLDGWVPAAARHASDAGELADLAVQRWAFHHVREILPSADIPHDPANVREFPFKPAALEDVRVSGVNGESLNLSQVLEATSTDGLVVLHKGAIVLEHYANGMTERSPHIMMSVSKSMLGLLAGILADRGTLGLSQLVTDIIPGSRPRRGPACQRQATA